MVGAHQAGHPARAILADLRAAVAAHIVEGMDVAAAVPHHDDRCTADGSGQIGAGVRQFGLKADLRPVSIEDGLQVELKHLRIGIQRLRQAVPRLALVEESRNAFDVVHGGAISRE